MRLERDLDEEGVDSGNKIYRSLGLSGEPGRDGLHETRKEISLAGTKGEHGDAFTPLILLFYGLSMAEKA